MHVSAGSLLTGTNVLVPMLLSPTVSAQHSAPGTTLASFSTSNGDPNLFLEDEYTATIFNATARDAIPVPAWHGGGEAPSHRRREQHMKSCHMCSGVSVWTVAAGLMYGLTRCATWTSCDCLFHRLHGVDSACSVSCRLRERGRV